MSARVALWSALLVSAAWAQETQPDVTFRSDTRLVVLNISVFDKEGKIVRSLPKSAFSVFENGEKQDIKVFRQEDVPVSLGLIIDNSASMHDKLDRVASAALDMVRASNPEDEVFIIKFNEEAFLTKDFTSNVKELETSLHKLETEGETAMRDALLLGIEHLRHRAKKDKKVLLVVTDGDDNSSVETLDHLVQVAHQNDVIIYGIGLLSAEPAPGAERAKKALDQLTLATGGRCWFPNDVAEIERITPEIAHEVRNQYVIGYTPTNLARDGTFRKIRVEVSAPGATVRTRSGYYASR